MFSNMFDTGVCFPPWNDIRESKQMGIRAVTVTVAAAVRT